MISDKRQVKKWQLVQVLKTAFPYLKYVENMDKQSLVDLYNRKVQEATKQANERIKVLETLSVKQ